VFDDIEAPGEILSKLTRQVIHVESHFRKPWGRLETFQGLMGNRTVEGAYAVSETITQRRRKLLDSLALFYSLIFPIVVIRLIFDARSFWFWFWCWLLLQRSSCFGPIKPSLLGLSIRRFKIEG